MANFTLSKLEEKKAKNFRIKHKLCGNLNKLYEYKLIPNGMGIEVYIKCPHCGKEKDITDVTCW